MEVDANSSSAILLTNGIGKLKLGLVVMLTSKLSFIFDFLSFDLQ